MDLKTRMEVLPCGKCEDMMSCDNCIFVKEAKELYKQIKADAIEECIKIVRNIPRHYYLNEVLEEMEQLKEHK